MPRLPSGPLSPSAEVKTVALDSVQAFIPEAVFAAAEAKQQVPSLVLVNGEDLTPYRQASKSIFSVLARFGTAERLGMDEVRLLQVSAHSLWCVNLGTGQMKRDWRLVIGLTVSNLTLHRCLWM